jgi:hypothetical protein
MKLTLTLSEVADQLRQKYSLPPNTAVEITDGSTSLRSSPFTDTLTMLRNRMQAGGYLTDMGSIVPSYKIAAIKLLREIVEGCGLKQAKDAIEDWSRFCTYVGQYGYPPMTVESPEFGWRK